LAAAVKKTPGQKIWFYSIRVPKPPTHPVILVILMPRLEETT
jgi:hypothetical protein